MHITDSCFQLFFLQLKRSLIKTEMKGTAAVMNDLFCQHLENIITSNSDMMSFFVGQ